MKIIAPITLMIAGFLAIVLISPAHADRLPLYDGKGNTIIVDTTKLTGCTIVFDSHNRPLEICPMVSASGNTVVVVEEEKKGVLNNERQQDRSTARRVYRRMERRD